MSVKRPLPVDQAPAVIRTATKLVRKVTQPTQKISAPNVIITNNGDSCMIYELLSHISSTSVAFLNALIFSCNIPFAFS